MRPCLWKKYPFFFLYCEMWNNIVWCLLKRNLFFFFCSYCCVGCGRKLAEVDRSGWIWQSVGISAASDIYLFLDQSITPCPFPSRKIIKVLLVTCFSYLISQPCRLSAFVLGQADSLRLGSYLSSCMDTRLVLCMQFCTGDVCFTSHDNFGVSILQIS